MIKQRRISSILRAIRYPWLRYLVGALAHVLLFYSILQLTVYFPFKFRNPPSRLGDGILDVLIWNPVRHYSVATLIMLGVEGFLVGRFTKLSVGMAALLPAFLLGLISALEMELVPGTHNLWGIEVVLYFLNFTAPIFVGGMLGRWFRKQREKPKKPAGCRRCRYDLRGNVSGVCPECGLVLFEPQR